MREPLHGIPREHTCTTRLEQQHLSVHAPLVERCAGCIRGRQIRMLPGPDQQTANMPIRYSPEEPGFLWRGVEPGIAGGTRGRPQCPHFRQHPVRARRTIRRRGSRHHFRHIRVRVCAHEWHSWGANK